MANQAIALQARAPQAPSLSGVIQQNAMLINQAMQAQAAQRQSQAKQQEMQLAREKNTREASDAQIKYAGEVAKVFKEELAMLPPGDVRGAEALRRMTVERVPGWDAILPSADAIANDKGTRQRLLMKADEIISYTTPKPVASAQQDAEGNFYGVTVGGLGAPTAEKVVITPTLPEAKAPPASPQKIIDDGVAAILEGAGVNDPRLQNLDEKQFREIQSRASQQLLAKPISYEPDAVSDVEPLTLENAPQIVQAALDSGFIDPTHVEQLKQMLPPENQAAVDQWVQQSGLKMGKGIPGAQSAVYRPQQADFGAAVADDGMAFGGPQAPFAQQIVNEPGTQFRGKPPTQSPLPGSAQVPLSRVGAEARAQRETPEEVYAKEKARARAQREAALEAGPKPLTPTQEAKLRDNIAKDYKSAQSTIDMMLNPVSGVIAAVQSVRKLTPEQKEAVTGWSGYLPSVSASSRSADTKIKNLKGKVTEMGKAAASLTGAIGQMAVQEWRIVSDMIANLDLEGMNASDLDDQLQIIESQARRAAAVTQDAYENQYVEEFARYPNRFQLKVPGGSAPANQMSRSNLPRVRNNADFNRLKPGTLFIDPNGETRRKP